MKVYMPVSMLYAVQARIKRSEMKSILFYFILLKVIPPAPARIFIQSSFAQWQSTRFCIVVLSNPKPF